MSEWSRQFYTTLTFTIHVLFHTFNLSLSKHMLISFSWISLKSIKSSLILTNKKYLYTRLVAHCEPLLIRSEDHHLQLIRPSQHEPIDFRRYQSSIDQQIDVINRPLPRVLQALVVSGPTDIESSLHHSIDFNVSWGHLGFNKLKSQKK